MQVLQAAYAQAADSLETGPITYPILLAQQVKQPPAVVAAWLQVRVLVTPQPRPAVKPRKQI